MAHDITELYQGEVLGEALFNRMLSDVGNPHERHVVASMLQLETETKARLRQVVARRDLPIVEDGAYRAAGESVGASLAPMTWMQKMRRLEAGIGTTYLPRYQEIAADAAPHDEEITAYMVVHETALLEVVRREIAGAAGSSVDAIEGHLSFPLPRPSTGPR